MKPRYKVVVSTSVVKDVLTKAQELTRNKRDTEFLSYVERKMKTGDLSLSPKQFYWLCGIAHVKPHSSLYRVSKTRQFNW